MKEDELRKLMAFVGKGENPTDGPDSAENGLVDDLISVLSLPELQEQNNPDLPFEIKGRYRGSCEEDFIQTTRLTGMAYDRESSFLADWMGKLSRRTDIQCFDKSVGIEFKDSSDGLIHLQIEKDESQWLLRLSCHGHQSHGAGLEIWEKGALIRKAKAKENGDCMTMPVHDGTSLFVRKTNLLKGVEFLLSQGEFAQEDWITLATGLCIQGKLARVVEIFSMDRPTLFLENPGMKRFIAFLKRLVSMTKSNGYVLSPMPVFRADQGPAMPQLDESGLNNLQDIKNWSIGWEQVNQRNYSRAKDAFAAFHAANQNEWNLPWEAEFAAYFDRINSGEASLPEEVDLAGRFWSGVFGDLLPILDQ